MGAKQIYVGIKGRVLALDYDSGAILWHNPLKGCGLGIGSLVIPGRPPQSAAMAAQIAADQQRAASNPAAT